MYTQLKLDALKTEMKMYSKLVLEHASRNGRGKSQSILVKYKGTVREPWVIASRSSNKDAKCKKIVTEKRLNKWIDYLLDHLHVQIGDIVMQQSIGIPMGTSCSPFLANLMLFMYEVEYFSDEISRL